MIEDHSQYQLLPDEDFDEDETMDNSEFVSRLNTALDESLDWARNRTRLHVTEYIDGVRLDPAMLTREELEARRAAREQPLYLAVFQRKGAQWLVHAPDVPEVTGTGATRDEAEQAFAAALVAHLQALRANGEPLPEPTADARFVSAAA